MDEGVSSRNADVIDDSDVTVLSSTNFQMLACTYGNLFRVYYIEHLFLIFFSQAFQDDVILFRLLHANNVNYFILVGDFEREDLLANLAVDLIKFKH